MKPPLDPPRGTSAIKPPALPTQRLVLANGKRRHLVWCGWCESLHHHELGDHGDHIGPQCSDNSGRSPLACVGYGMDIVCESVRSAAPPDFPTSRGFVFFRRFHRSIELSGAALRATLLGAIFAKKARVATPIHKGPGFRAAVMGGRWNIRYQGDDSHVEGQDLLALIAELFAVPAGVAAVRILEAATGAELDAQAALEVAAAIDDWRARGAPRNEGRRR